MEFGSCEWKLRKLALLEKAVAAICAVENAGFKLRSNGEEVLVRRIVKSVMIARCEGCAEPLAISVAGGCENDRCKPPMMECTARNAGGVRPTLRPEEMAAIKAGKTKGIPAV